MQKKWTTRCFIDCGNLTYSSNTGTTWHTGLLTGRALNSRWTLSTSVVPWWNPLWDCWQTVLMLITCLQPLPYQGLNLSTLEQYAAKEGKNREACKKWFQDRKHCTSKVAEMVTLSEMLLDWKIVFNFREINSLVLAVEFNGLVIFLLASF